MARRPKNVDLESLARGHTTSAILTLAKIMTCNESKDAARVAAAGILLDRGWGKAKQQLTGDDEDGAIRITLRKIVQNVTIGPMPSAEPVEDEPGEP